MPGERLISSDRLMSSPVAGDFESRAHELIARIAGCGLDDGAIAGLEQLRALWRSLSASQRAQAASCAHALARAQERALRAPSLFARPDAEDELAIRGLDRIAFDAPPSRPYAGPPDPDALLAHFGLEGFRPGQREAVLAALQGRDSLVVMPTGGGKSLCYQLPGIASEDLTVVVSPLIALMADQYRRLALGGHPATMVASGMAPGAAERGLSEVRDGSARIVLCSPERFASAAFLRALGHRRVDLFVVDEAHCLSEWGHDFRPDYLRLRGAIDRLGSPPVMAATATATEQVAAEIVQRLRLRDPLVLRAGFDRPNLSLDVIALDGQGSRARKRALLAAAMADGRLRPAIVYCGTRREVEEVAQLLSDEGLRAVGYHAGMAAEARAVAQHRFMEGEAEIVVATNAFGMGVDKADVRAVVHWSIPTSVEAYYQEVGRAGRDGLPARGILLASRADLGRLITFIKQDAVQPAHVRDFLARLRAGSPEPAITVEGPRDDRDRICLGIAERAGLCSLEPAGAGRLRIAFSDGAPGGSLDLICRAATDRAWRAYRAIERFCGPAVTCRRRMLLDHFGDPSPGAATGRCCDLCDPDTIALPDPARQPIRPVRGRGSRRRAGAPAAEPASAAKPASAAELAPADRPLFDVLRDWRSRASDGKPAYTVAHDRTLAQIAARRPTTLAELGAISGVGPAFLERHGQRVVAIVRRASGEDLTSPASPHLKARRAPRPATGSPSGPGPAR
ncbi:MAG TPA: ATP-dependent DNA helicase RecQ [Solirubrobacteraceae bacterium]|nr:ATP-dependent DNA helicase RecQ [Solirubrobacteraceae bacterium]